VCLLYVSVVLSAAGILTTRLSRAAQPWRRPRTGVGALLVAAALLAIAVPFARAATPRVTQSSVISAPVRTVRTAYGTVDYRAVGHGRPLVLIMGLGGSIDTWPPAFIAGLARAHRVIAFDNEGVGSSTLRPGTLTITRMGDDTAAFIAALHLRRPDVLGWSMGGFIAQAFAVRHPGDYRRLILSATGPGDGHAALPSAAVIRALAGQGGNALSDLFPPDQAREAAAFTVAIARYPHFYAAPPNVFGLQLSACTRWLTGMDPSGHHDGRISALTLIGDGVDDAIVPSANSRQMARLIPHARLKLYPDAGHGFIFQDEANWAAVIDRFLATPGG
jgi:pimeloyl-ACP methyl ester carboxylesterase